MAPDCIGDAVGECVDKMAEGDVILLENTRFYKEEEKNVPEFAEKLAANADLFVNDAFGTAHRAHGSTEGVTKYLSPSVAGFLLQKELDYLDGAVSEPKRPFAAIVGGSKVSSKIGVIESLMEKVDKIVIGGGMVFTFLKARGLETGSSLVEEDQLELAKKLEAIACARRRASTSSCRRTSSSPTSSPPTPPRRPSRSSRSPRAGWASTTAPRRPR